MDTMFQNVPHYYKSSLVEKNDTHYKFISSKTDPCLPFSNLHVVLYLGNLGNLTMVSQ